MYRSEKLDLYVGDAASGEPTPGGGSVSALAGALAAAMGEMAANFTVGKKKFAAVEAEARALLEELTEARESLMELVERDVEAYGAVDRAYSLPRKTDEQKAARREATADALRGAMQAPMEVMRHAARLGEIATRLVEIGNPNLITDVGVSAVLAEAACAAARLNVEINLKYLKDAALAAATTAEMDELARRARECRDSVSRGVAAFLEG